MKRLIALLVLAAVALVPAAASAKSRAKVYRGTFQLVGADGDYVTGKFGKAHLVDTRRDSLSVHVRRLAPRTKYVFRLQSGQTCKEGAAGGTKCTGWHYRRGGVLKTNRKGVANGSAKARHFRVASDKDYSVVVYEKLSSGQLGPVVLCAVLHTQEQGQGQAGTSRKRPRKPATSRSRDDKPQRQERGERTARATPPRATTRQRASKRATGPAAGQGRPSPRARRAAARRGSRGRLRDGVRGARRAPGRSVGVSSQRCSAWRPTSVTSPSASIQSRTRSSRTSPSASLGPGPVAVRGERARARLDRPAAGVQRRQRAALLGRRHVERVRARRRAAGPPTASPARARGRPGTARRRGCRPARAATRRRRP